MSGFQCPYCSMVMPVSQDTHCALYPAFDYQNGAYRNTDGHVCYRKSCLKVDFYKCPNCGQYSIILNGVGSSVEDVKNIHVRPSSLAIQFPSYIPESIRQDYEEAYAIVSLSPKASATLSRRCLQGMIRDFWKITDKKRLVDEIDALQDKVPASQWKILNSIRRIGNIGAHPEADVNLIIDIEPEDAQKLISIIELLIRQWYIERHEQEQLYKDVLELDQNMQSQKDKG